MTTYVFSVSRDGVVCVNPTLVKNEITDPLELAIAKWRFIVEQMEDGVRVEHCGGGSTCALCVCYHCWTCPVSTVADTHCAATPCMDFVTDPTLENARAELEFLEGLRDE